MPRFAPLAAAAAVLLASGIALGEGGGLAFEPGPPPFATVLAKAKAEKKVVFVDERNRIRDKRAEVPGPMRATG